MRKIFFVFVICLYVPLIVSALDIPVENAEISVSFAQNQFQTFSRGIVFNETESVRASESGQMLILIRDSLAESSFPSSLGTAVVMIHDNSMVTIYGNLADDSIPDNLVDIDSGMTIGKTGKSGYTGKGSLEFQISDRLHEKRINPQMLLPAQVDTLRPFISDITVQNENATYQITSKRLKQGTYNLFSKIMDHKESKNNLAIAPFQITVTQNGHEIRNLLFETLYEENGRLKMGEQQLARVFEDVYNDRGVCIGAIVLKRGKNELSITARDIAGNESSVNWSFSVD